MNALESGAYSFHAPLLKKLSQVFQEPIAYFVASDPRPVQAAAEWNALFERVPGRDRLMLLDLARKIVDWTGASQTHEQEGTPAKLVALEGIDGALVRDLGVRLARVTGGVHCDHDYASDLWRHMIERLKAHTAANEPEEKNATKHAMERTLLFTCERLERQESQVRPALDAGRHALVPFSAMASGVYQEAEGLADRRLIDIVSSLLLKPDAIVIVRSDPKRAVAKIVAAVPKEGQFFSVNTEVEIESARRLYERAAEEFRALGVRVHEVDVPDDAITDVVLKGILNELSDLMPVVRDRRRSGAPHMGQGDSTFRTSKRTSIRGRDAARR